MDARPLEVPPQPAPTHSTPATAAEAKAAISALRAGLRQRDVGGQVAALRTAGAVNDISIVREIRKLLRKDPAAATRGQAYDTLRRYLATPYREEVVDILAASLAREVDRERSRIAKADPGVLINPRTGEEDIDSREGSAVYEATAAAGRATATLLAGLVESGWQLDARKGVELWPLLQSADDAVVVMALRMLGAAGDDRALGEMLGLFQQYPSPSRFETGGVVDRSGTNASAKAKWMVRFGHPDKRRSRPHVHEALREAIRAITGEDVHTPRRLEALIRARD